MHGNSICLTYTRGLEIRYSVGKYMNWIQKIQDVSTTMTIHPCLP